MRQPSVVVTMACFGAAMLTVIVVSLLNSSDKRRGWERLKAQNDHHGRSFRVVTSPPDGKCLYHSLLTGLQYVKLANKTLTVDELMTQVKRAYAFAIKNRNNDPLVKALEGEITKETGKIDALLSGKMPLLGKTGFPDVGAIQLLIHQGYFPYRVNLGVMNEQKKLEVTEFLSLSSSVPPTIYVRQVGGDEGIGGHFDALILN